MVDICEDDIKNKKIHSYSVRYMEKKETLERLKDKLLEEAKEVFEAYEKEDKAHLKEEIADVVEVIDAILYHNNFTLKEILSIRDAKKEKRGGFEKGIYLENVDYVD